MSSRTETVTGPAVTALANKISDAIYEATLAGMELDEAVGICVSVAADYARSHYGNTCLPHLAALISGRAKAQLPKNGPAPGQEKLQ